MKLLIIQPWFTAVGHPAQSLINLASAIGQDRRVDYLVSKDTSSDFFKEPMQRLSAWGKVDCYTVKTAVGSSNTVRALLVLLRMRFKGCRYQRIFFFDESLYVLALLWPIISLWLSAERISVLHLFGPEMGVGLKSGWIRYVIGRFLNRCDVRLYLRTDEMVQAWRDVYKLALNSQIKCLPSLEIPDGEVFRGQVNYSDKLAFGIIGQIRIGKGIEWLVPVFQKDHSLGKLSVVGEFNTPQTRQQLSTLREFDGFINCFMSEDEMLEHAAAQDYLLMLYDLWDGRMESAVLYLAARVNRPVIVYADSWCGRMVREFGCGLVAPTGHEETVALLRRVPRPGSAEYDELLKGMDAFREAHSVKSLRSKVIQELLY